MLLDPLAAWASWFRPLVEDTNQNAPAESFLSQPGYQPFFGIYKASRPCASIERLLQVQYVQVPQTPEGAFETISEESSSLSVSLEAETR